MKTIATPTKPVKWPAITLAVLLFFLFMTHTWSLKYESRLVLGLCASVLLIVALFFKEHRDRLRHAPDGIGLMLFLQSAFCLVGLSYAIAGMFALQQLCLTAGGYFIFLFAYVYFARDKHAIPDLLGPLLLCVGIVSLISIELATSRYLLAPLQGLGGLLSFTVPDSYAAMETNTRITSVLGEPNVFAPATALCMFLSLWVSTQMTSFKKTLYLANAFVCCIAFVLCFSMGTILTYGLALVVMFLFTARAERLRLVIQNGYCLLLSLLLATLTYASKDASILPLVIVLLGSAGAAFAFSKLPQPQQTSDRKRSPLKLFLTAAILVSLAVVAALLQGAYTLHKDEGFRRAVRLDSGNQTLTLQLDGAQDAAVNINVYSMNRAQAALKENTTLANATLSPQSSTLSFTVPADASAVFFQLSAGSDVTIQKASITNGSVSESLPLRYTLLPEFIVNRLQGYWVNDNAMQRFVFFRDGIRLGATSPLLGLGGGAFSIGVYAVADYSYETTHTHNQFIQAFVDGGIIGFGLFTALTILCFVALWKWRRREPEATALPYLTGCIVLLFFHCMLDVEFMYGSYMLLFSVILAALAALCQDADTDKKPARSKLFLFATGALLLVCTLLFFGRSIALNIMSKDTSLDNLSTAMRLDPCNADTYHLSLLQAGAQQQLDSDLEESTNAFLDQVKKRSFLGEISFEVAQYYINLSKPDVDSCVSLCETYVHEYRVDPAHWKHVFQLYNNILNAYPKDETIRKKIAASTMKLYSYLQELNTTLPKQIAPDLTELAYTRAQSILKGDPDTVMLDSRILYDTNKDGVSDIIHTDGGTTHLQTALFLPKDQAFSFRIYAAPTCQASIIANGNHEIPLTYRADLGCFSADDIGGDNVSFTLDAAVNAVGDDIYFTVTTDPTSTSEQ